jgi:hypothetical protein
MTRNLPGHLLRVHGANEKKDRLAEKFGHAVIVLYIEKTLYFAHHVSFRFADGLAKNKSFS